MMIIYGPGAIFNFKDKRKELKKFSYTPTGHGPDGGLALYNRIFTDVTSIGIWAFKDYSALASVRDF